MLHVYEHNLSVWCTSVDRAISVNTPQKIAKTFTQVIEESQVKEGGVLSVSVIGAGGRDGGKYYSSATDSH